MFQFHSHSFRVLAAILCAALLPTAAQAAQVDSDDTYRFISSDFTTEPNQLLGIFITGLPEPQQGSVQLKERFLQPGDVLTVEQLDYMMFHPHPTETDACAEVSFLPIFTDHVDPETVMTISIHGKEDKPPVAEDSSIETYKNIPNQAPLKVADPEQQPMTYTVLRPPKRGIVQIQDDGIFIYTPKHNKVGTDSFTFTASDPSGNTSREATVTVQILKPSDSQQYTDTIGSDCRFCAEWMRHAGLYSGEIINGQACFSPDKPTTRGEFLSMLMEVLDLPVERSAQQSGFIDDSPMWLKPYLAAALRSGLITGYQTSKGIEFRPDEPIRCDDASAMIRRALEFAIPAAMDSDGIISAWVHDAQQAAAAAQFELPQGDAVLTRNNTAVILYEVSRLKAGNPGLSVLFQ